MPLEFAFLLHERYKIEALLGHGGMGAVYRAFDTLTDRPCAIKEFRLGHLPREDELMLGSASGGKDDPSASFVMTRERAASQFKREAKMLAGLSHFRLPKVTDYFGVDDEYYLVMTLVEGRDLSMIYNEIGREPIPEQQVLNWMAQVIDALVFCHSRGVVHRDVKPGNVIITEDNEAYLVDFGIAKYVGPEQAVSTPTQVMTPGYSPPEQYLGQGKTDGRSDVYSVGATMYMLLTGVKPPEAIQRVMGERLIPPNQLVGTISGPISDVVVKAMALKPPERYQTMEELRDALRAARQMVERLAGEQEKTLAGETIVTERPSEEEAEKETAPQELNQQQGPIDAGEFQEYLETYGQEQPDLPGKTVTVEDDTGLFLKAMVDSVISKNVEEFIERAEKEGAALGPGVTGEFKLVLPAEDLQEREKPDLEEELDIVKARELPAEVVALDGSGTYGTLEEAVRKAKKGTRLTLKPGLYMLAQTLVIEKPLYLQGSGAKRVSVVSTVPGAVVRYTGKETLFVEGISFAHEGKAPANVFEVGSGSTHILDCQFSGAVADSAGGLGMGVKLSGKARVVIRNSAAVQNQKNGFLADEEVQLVMERNTARENGRSGIVLLGGCTAITRGNVLRENAENGIDVGGRVKAQLEGDICQQNSKFGLLFYSGLVGGVVKECQFLENGIHGIMVGGKAAPMLEYNLCLRNHQAGIQYIGQAAGTAMGNRCEGNWLHGISIGGQAWPRVELNYARKNREVGILYYENASGNALENQCDRNRMHGIEVTGKARPHMEKNVCFQNNQVGIRYASSEVSAIRGNRSEENGLYGIEVVERASPQVEANLCKRNKQGGILFIGSSGGIVRMNQCEMNARFGIGVGGAAHPTLKTNLCRENRESGILFTERASGLAMGNQCEVNSHDGIQVEGESEPQIEFCTCKENRRSGIGYFAFAGGTAQKNTCEDNLVYGISIQDSANPRLMDNELSRNGKGDTNR